MLSGKILGRLPVTSSSGLWFQKLRSRLRNLRIGIRQTRDNRSCRIVQVLLRERCFLIDCGNPVQCRQSNARLIGLRLLLQNNTRCLSARTRGLTGPNEELLCSDFRFAIFRHCRQQATSAVRTKHCKNFAAQTVKFFRQGD